MNNKKEQSLPNSELNSQKNRYYIPRRGPATTIKISVITPPTTGSFELYSMPQLIMPRDKPMRHNKVPRSTKKAKSESTWKRSPRPLPRSTSIKISCGSHYKLPSHVWFPRHHNFKADQLHKRWYYFGPPICPKWHIRPPPRKAILLQTANTCKRAGCNET